MIIMSFADGKRLKSGPACGRSAGLPVSWSRHFLVYHIDSQTGVWTSHCVHSLKCKTPGPHTRSNQLDSEGAAQESVFILPPQAICRRESRTILPSSPQLPAAGDLALASPPPTLGLTLASPQVPCPLALGWTEPPGSLSRAHFSKHLFLQPWGRRHDGTRARNRTLCPERETRIGHPDLPIGSSWGGQAVKENRGPRAQGLPGP